MTLKITACIFDYTFNFMNLLNLLMHTCTACSMLVMSFSTENLIYLCLLNQ